MRRSVAAAAFLLALGTAQAQQLYRWVDESGRVNFSDTPPPKARDVEARKYGGGTTASPQAPFEFERAQKNYPVTLYTSPVCKEPCAQARAALNRRGVPFKEVQVWEEESRKELHRVSGYYEVPVLTVGRTVQKGFEQGAFDSLLDSAGYPRAGILPARTHAAPPPPEGYVPPSEREAPTAVAEPEAPMPPPAPLGPYAPR
jgi:glutaredoxin